MLFLFFKFEEDFTFLVEIRRKGHEQMLALLVLNLSRKGWALPQDPALVAIDHFECLLPLFRYVSKRVKPWMKISLIKFCFIWLFCNI